MSEIITYMAGENEITLSPEIIRKQLTDNPQVTEQEITMFLRLCEFQKLNPFLKEAYLIKYGTSPASLIVGKEAWTKRAEAQPTFRGYRAGIAIATENGELIYREGSLLLPKETIVGGWCEVLREGWSIPVRAEVSFAEYSTGKSGWARMPATMIRKVALTQALREAFPVAFAGMYGEEEMSKTLDKQAEAKTSPTVRSNTPNTPTTLEVLSEVPKPTIQGLTKVQQDEIWRTIRGSKVLLSQLLKETGKKKLGEINTKAFPKLLKMATELAALSGLKPSEPASLEYDYELDNQPETEREEVTPLMLASLEDLIKGCDNGDELFDAIKDACNIFVLSELTYDNYMMAINVVNEHGIFHKVEIVEEA